MAAGTKYTVAALTVAATGRPDDDRVRRGVAVERAVQRQAGDAERRHRAVDVRARQRDRNRGGVFEPRAGARIGLRRVVDRAHGDRGGRRAGVIGAVVVDRQHIGSWSEPLKLDRRHEVHRRRVAGGRHRSVQHDSRVSRPASLYSVPFNGRLVMRNDATVPSMSEPDSETAIEAAFSSPEPEPALVSGASLTAPTLIEAVAGLASSAPVLSIAA